MRSASLAYLFVFAPAVAAQGLVSPAHFAAAEAPSSNRFPFGNAPSAPFRYLQVHDDLQGSPRAIRGMSFRRVGSTCGVPEESRHSTRSSPSSRRRSGVSASSWA